MENTFFKDLRFAQHYERLAKRYFTHDSCEMPAVRDSDFDLIFKHKDKTFTVEVKADRKAHETQNLVIENRYDFNPSGITVTKADYWLFFVILPENKIATYKIETEKLKIMCRGRREIYSTYAKTHLYIIPLSEMEKYRIHRLPA